MVSILFVATVYEERIGRMKLVDSEKHLRAGASALMSAELVEAIGPHLQLLKDIAEKEATFKLFEPMQEYCKHSSTFPFSFCVNVTEETPSKGINDAAELVNLCLEFQKVTKDQQSAIRALEDEVFMLRRGQFRPAPDVERVEAMDMLAHQLRRCEADSLLLFQKSAKVCALAPASSDFQQECHTLKAISSRLHQDIISAQSVFLALGRN
eukprot:GILI01039582.1.p1 GENE.GILI01039582.1~~GILI01039582.1.p1  ORF type:complete len:230 (-),score=4.81 GILI01039582.1:107-736(-)